MLRLVKIAAIGAKHNTMGLLLVVDRDSLCRLACHFYRFSDD